MAGFPCSGRPGRARFHFSTHALAFSAVNAVQSDRSAGSRDFPKHRRVRRRADYQQVFARGSRLHSRFFTVVVLPNGGPSPRLGLVASRKFGDAVSRNRAKRLIREMFRGQMALGMSLGADLVVIPRRELLEVPFHLAVQDFRNLWRRAAERIVTSPER